MGIRGDRVLDTQHIPSGTRKLSISIGGIRCAILCHDTSFIDLLRARYQWFESSGPAAYEILVKLMPVEDLTADNARASSRILIKKVNSGDNYIIKQADKLFVAVANISSNKVLVKMWKSEYYFDSFLRILFTLILANKKGLVLHASAVSENGRGSVFFGPSGSGKTTIAQLSAGRTLLSDEMVIIKPHNGGYRVYGAPFWSEFTLGQSSVRAELDGLYSLKKDHMNSLMSLDRMQALLNLYQCVPFFDDDSQLRSRILDNCRTLVDAIPIYELHFLPDLSFWQILNEHNALGTERSHFDIRLRHAA
jgi:hypothetical protein